MYLNPNLAGLVLAGVCGEVWVGVCGDQGLDGEGRGHRGHRVHRVQRLGGQVTISNQWSVVTSAVEGSSSDLLKQSCGAAWCLEPGVTSSSCIL